MLLRGTRHRSPPPIRCTEAVLRKSQQVAPQRCYIVSGSGTLKAEHRSSLISS